MATSSSVAAVRRRSVSFDAAKYMAGLARTRTLDEGRIATQIAAIAQHSGHQVHRNVRLGNGFVADLMFASTIAILVRTAYRPGPTPMEQLKRCVEGGVSGIVLLSSVPQHRRVPSSIGTVPIAFVPLRIECEVR